MSSNKFLRTVLCLVNNLKSLMRFGRQSFLPAFRTRKELFSDTKRGFTLLELLVVMSIIGILAALSLTGFNAARKNARDTQVKSDLGQYRAALEAYFSSRGFYPNHTQTADYDYTWGSGGGIFSTAGPIVNEYMPSILIHPRNNESVCGTGSQPCWYLYTSASSGSPLQYELMARLETGGWWQICSDGRAGYTSTADWTDSNCDL